MTRVEMAFQILKIVHKFTPKGNPPWIEMFPDGSGQMTLHRDGADEKLFDWDVGFSGIEKAFGEWIVREYK